MSEASTVMFFVWQICSLAQMQLRTMAEDDYDQFYKVDFFWGVQRWVWWFLWRFNKEALRWSMFAISAICGCCPRMLCAKWRFSGLGLPAKNLIILVVAGTGKGYDSKLCQIAEFLQLKGRGWRVKFPVRISKALWKSKMLPSTSINGSCSDWTIAGRVPLSRSRSNPPRDDLRAFKPENGCRNNPSLRLLSERNSSLCWTMTPLNHWHHWKSPQDWKMLKPFGIAFRTPPWCFR